MVFISTGLAGITRTLSPFESPPTQLTRLFLERQSLVVSTTAVIEAVTQIHARHFRSPKLGAGVARHVGAQGRVARDETPTTMFGIAVTAYVLVIRVAGLDRAVRHAVGAVALVKALVAGADAF